MGAVTELRKSEGDLGDEDCNGGLDPLNILVVDCVYQAAFVECDDAPNFWIAYGVSDNHGEQYSQPLFDTVNPYGFVRADNSCQLD